MRFTDPSGAPSGAGSATEGRTRDAVIRLLLAEGPITAAALADRLALSPAAIRRHLDSLDADGHLASRPAHAGPQRGRGRPARAYLLSETGRARLPHTYDDLAIDALEFIAETAGPAAVAAFARRRAEAVVAGVRPELAAASNVAERAVVLSEALTTAGFAASLEQVGIGQQLCQHHCPVAHVAAKFPQLCEEEMAVFTETLGTYAQRLATIARGDSFCTTFIPLAGGPPDRPAPSSSADSTPAHPTSVHRTSVHSEPAPSTSAPSASAFPHDDASTPDRTDGRTAL